MAGEKLTDFGIILRHVRETLKWSQGHLSDASGISISLIADYEQGRKSLHRERGELLISFMGPGPDRIDELLGMMESLREGSRLSVDDPFNSRRRRIEAIASQAGRLAAGFARSVLNLLTVGSESVHSHDKADFLWRKLKREKPEDRRLLIEEQKRYRHWGLAERMTRESLDAAPNHPKEALELARDAVRLAELVPGTQAWCWRLQGFAGAALINAYRVCNDLPEARKARSRARKLWDDGEAGDPGLLDEALLPCIEATLYRADREFPEALRKIDEALALDTGELRGKILLTKASVHHALDELEAATATILEAVPLLDQEREPRLALSVRHDLVVNLAGTGRALEARQQLGEVRKLAERLGGERDLVRVGWLAGVVAAGLGEEAEALRCLEQARSAFRGAGQSYDYALVSMDLTAFLLERGELGRVRTMAEEMLGIFRAQQVDKEALKAIRLFCEAARREAATVELARRVARFLNRAQAEPELKFEAETA